MLKWVCDHFTETKVHGSIDMQTKNNGGGGALKQPDLSNKGLKYSLLQKGFSEELLCHTRVKMTENED